MDFFDTIGFVRRFDCGIWPLGLPQTIIGADLVIFASYMVIPLILVYYAKRWSLLDHVVVRWITALFAGFIFFCGISHALDSLMFTFPAYRLLALERVLTALLSLATAASLPYLCRHLKIEWTNSNGRTP